jgi:hypothetical protein
MAKRLAGRGETAASFIESLMARSFPTPIAQHIVTPPQFPLREVLIRASMAGATAIVSDWALCRLEGKEKIGFWGANGFYPGIPWKRTRLRDQRGRSRLIYPGIYRSTPWDNLLFDCVA